ncbi:MAG: arsenic efflux protein [Lachnospiraceae bacterium]|nr:arsenic efflux protein [Lachnospiraceae bacterium]
MILDILLDAVLDCVKELPFLFCAFLLLEALEHHTSESMNRLLARAGRSGPLLGALLGCVPQCGFSIMASDFYAGGVITAGTLLSVFLSTSDEAVIILLTDPGHAADVGRLIVTKVVIGILAGYAVYFAEAFYRRRHPGRGKRISDLCEDCGCHDEEEKPVRVRGSSHEHAGGSFRHILKPALRHTSQVFFFLFIFTLLLGFLIEVIGLESLSRVFLSNTVFQPVIAALIGLIPNCAASVILTELYLEGVISFGSAVAGLCSAAGLGLLVLFRINRDKRECFRVTGLLLMTAIVSGVILQLLPW